MPGKKSDSVKRSGKFRSLLPLDDNVPERFSGDRTYSGGKDLATVLRVVGL